MVGLVERGATWQEWRYEANHRLAHPSDMMTVSHQDMMPFDVVCDANDLYDILCKPALGSQTDLQMSIYVSSLRHDCRSGRVRHRYWVNTHAMLADIGTKIDDDGLVVPTDLRQVIVNGWLSVRGRWRLNGGVVQEADASA